MTRTHKLLTFIAIIFIAIVMLINNNEAVLINTHEITVVKFNYGEDSLYSGKGLGVPKAEYVKIKSYRGKEYKIYTKKNVTIPTNKRLTIYEYKRGHNDMHFFTLHKK